MNRNQLLALGLLLVVGIGAVVTGVVFVWSGGETAGIAPDKEQAFLANDAKKTDPGDLTTFEIIAEEPESFDDPPADDSVRIDLPTTTGDLRYLVVQVWDGEPGMPAAEADVYFLDGFEGDELTDPFAQHWSTLAESRGEKFKTDAQGRVELPPVKEWAMMTAQRSGQSGDPGMYGFARVGREHRAVETIILRPDETVTVRVVDGEDKPVAGVPVGVVQHVPDENDPEKLWEQMKQLQEYRAKVEEYVRANPSQKEAAQGRMRDLEQREGKLNRALRQTKADYGKQSKKRGGRARGEKKRPQSSSRLELRARRYTDDEGIALFRHFQVYRHEPEGWWPEHLVDQFEAVLLMPLEQPGGSAFSGRPVPSDTIELHMPPTGSIALRTVDLDGRPYRHPVNGDLHMEITGAPPWTRVQARKEQNDEAIVFPFAGLGLQFKARCRLDDNDFTWEFPTFFGPSTPGERIDLDMVVAPDAGMLFGRLLDGTGTPLAGAEPAFLISSHAGRLEGEEVTLDDKGRFHLPYRVNEPHAAPFRLEIRRNDVTPTTGRAMTLNELPEAKVTDLGDLRIDALGRIALGTVVNDLGEPIEGATIQLQRERMRGGGHPRLEFVDEDFTSVRTDDEGRFELFGDLDKGRHRLHVEAAEHFPIDTADLGRGETLELTLDRKARVVGTVLTPTWMPANSVRVRLELMADPQQQRDDQVHDHEGKTYVYFDWVRPGIYSVVIRTRDFPDPFLRIDGIEIAPGQMDIHPRLQDLDLGRYLHRFEVTAVDDRGEKFQPNRPLLARIVRPKGETGFVGFPWRNGRTEIFSVSPSLDVWPEAQGYHAEPTVLVHGECELRFLKIPPVEVHVPGLRQIVGTMPVWIGMKRAPVQDSGSGLPNRLVTWDGRSNRIAGWYTKTSRAAYASLGEDEIARIELSRDGIYQLEAYMGGRKAHIEFGTAEVKLEPGEKPQKVTVTIFPDEVRAVLDEAGASRGGGK